MKSINLQTDMKRRSSPSDIEKPVGTKQALQAGVSIQTELALEQLKQKHEEDLQLLNMQLETQVNYYERSLEQMRLSMEVERKDIAQAFKLEISELEEQKEKVEQQAKQLRDVVEKLSHQLQSAGGGGGGGGGGWSSEQKRRMQREQAELEQNFAKEIRNLVERLSQEKEQQEAELKLKMDQEVQLVRTQLEEERSETTSLQERLRLLQQEVQTLEEEAEKRRRRLLEEESEHQRSREEQERLHRENAMCREEVLDLSSRNLQLSDDNAVLTSRLQGDQEMVRMLQEGVATARQEQEEAELMARRLQDTALQLQAAWTQEKTLLQEELAGCRQQLGGQVEARDAELKLQHAEEENVKLLRDVENTNNKVEALQRSLIVVETEAEHLRLQLRTIGQEKLGYAHQMSELQLEVQQAHNKAKQLESLVRRLTEEKEELRQLLEKQLEQDETNRQGAKDQIIKLSEDQQSLRSRLKLQKGEHMLVQEQALRANAALSRAQEQLQRAGKAQQEVDDGCRQQAEALQQRLEEAQRWSQQLEEALKLQSEQQQATYEKAASALQQRSKEQEVKLKGVRLLLQEKVQQLQEELAKSSACSAQLKEAYLENVQLVAALGVTEQRQKEAEKKNRGLKDQVDALKQLLKEVVTVTLVT